MNKEEAIARTRTIIEEAWNKGNVDVLDDIYHPDIAYYNRPLAEFKGLDALKEYIINVRMGMPDFHLDIVDIIYAEEAVITKWTWKATHTEESPIQIVPPTGKALVISGCTIAYGKEGKTYEEWSYGDHFSMFQQLGVIPEMTAAPEG